MLKSIADTLRITVLGAILAAGSGASALAQEENSGFLRDYTSLKEGKDTAKQTIRGWVSLKFKPENYNALLVDPLVFYPEPKPSKQVSGAELQRMLAYSNDLLKQTLSKRFKVVDQAGPGVVRIRVAFSSVAGKGEGLKPYQYVPMAFVVTMAKKAVTGGGPQRAAIVVETEATDSATGELLGMRVKAGTGDRLVKVGDQEVITLETLKPLLDELAGQAFPEMGKYVKAK